METPVYNAKFTQFCRRAISLLVGLSINVSPVLAQTAPPPSENVCLPTSGFYIAFFNGVWNTAQDAADGAFEVLEIAGDTHKAADTGQAEDIRVVSLYNTTGTVAGATKLQDVAEVFIQRGREASIDVAQRWELFWDVVTGDRSSAWEVIKEIANIPALTIALFSLAQAKAVAFMSSVASSPPTEADMESHNATIARILSEKKKLVLIAHSQGNLFLNRAYEKALTIPTSDGGTVSGANVKAVHVAPASILVKGDYTLANIDAVIDALKLAGGGIKDKNLTLPASPNTDVTGHLFIETYLDPSRAGRAAVTANLMTALDTVQPPKTQGVAGFFTATLTWDGRGDVDLYVTEPNSTRVYYGSKIGQSGFLDTDNTEANGPEHYTASCERSKLQQGSYRIGINNFADADGRKATLTISSSKSGEIFKKLSLDVGTADNGTTVIPVVTVKVRPSPVDQVLEAVIE
jgi:hypothetical protein